MKKNRKMKMMMMLLDGEKMNPFRLIPFFSYFFGLIILVNVQKKSH